MIRVALRTFRKGAFPWGPGQVRRVCCLFPGCRPALLALCALALWSCGYRLAGKETHLPAGIHSIAIPTFANRTFEPRAEVPFTQAFLREFIRDQRLKVVDRAQADAVLEGAITSIIFRSVSYDDKGVAREYRTHVTVDLTFRRREGEIIWRENNLTETRWFRTIGSGKDTTNTGAMEQGAQAELNDSSRFTAIAETAALVAERVRNRVFYNF
jgi:outer membrane lipopolysaccharide assembly protein LptE/RlpB